MRIIIIALSFALFGCGPAQPRNLETCSGDQPIFEACEGYIGIVNVPQFHLRIDDGNIAILAHVAHVVEADLINLGCKPLGGGNYTCSGAPTCYN